MKRILIDTDVILDFFFDRKPFSENSARILTLCHTGKITGYMTSVIISNTYYLLRKTASHEKVVDKLKQLLSFTDILTTDKSIIINALNSGFSDFVDAIQNFSAESSNKINVIVTRNTKDYKVSSLSVFSPEEFLRTLKNSD